MKKKLFTVLLVAASLFCKAQDNTLMTADFWRTSPSLSVVKAEIAKGNNPSQQNAGFFDPVVMAINNKASNDVIIYLIQQEGNSITKKTHHSRTYLQWASAQGNLELVNYLITKGSDVHYKDSHGLSVAAYAAGSNKNIAVYEALFQAGVDPKTKYENGTNLIMYAIASDNDLKITDYLISKGISLTDKDDFGRTVADYAAKLGDLQIIDALAKRGIKPTNQALFFAAQGSRQKQNGLETFEALITKYNLDPKATNVEGATMLHVLAKKQNNALINYFVNQGVDLSKADKDGNTILMNAVTGNNVDFIKLLLSKSKNIQTVNEDGESALTKAVASGSADMVALLLANGADVNVTDKNGKNLAYYCFSSFRPTPNNTEQNKDFERKIDLLKNAGLDLTLPQEDGSTILHFAVEKQNVDLVHKALMLGVNLNAQDLEGNSALHKAALTAKDDLILSTLVQAGINKGLKTEFDETAFDLANENTFLKNNKINIDFLKN